jgi:hypothetical protein
LVNYRIAVLGWGSLLWDGGTEFDAWHGPWRFDGPVLDVEFSRISKSRRGALTLVLDPEHGTPNQVAYCLSKRSVVADALADLRRRERTNDRNIGTIVLPEKRARSHHLPSCEAIRDWAGEKKLYAVIWTDLPSNFNEQVGQPFSVEAALTYLKDLPPAGQQQAAEYFSRAPSFIHTRLRDALRAAQWRAEAVT